LIYAFDERNLRRLIKLARKTAKRGHREICGFLAGHGRFIIPVLAKNQIKKGGSFRISQGDIEAAERSGKILNLQSLGTFHSHPLYFAKPGESDIRQAPNDSLMLIIDCIGNEAKLWRIKNKRARPVKFGLV
jgi:proteasome lid subunit RPN8/RPN11